MISGEEQNPLKCLSSLGEIWSGIELIFCSMIADSFSSNNRCDRTKKSIEQRKWPTVVSKAKALRAEKTSGQKKLAIDKKSKI
ncbi:MAG: hypothetical protein NWP91_02815 [Rickettsiaceae bacterium]|nr:hypothetical protein [Rickettsiaceae bacterium]